MKLIIKARGQVFEHETDKETVNIGRSSENDFVIPLDDFSRKHCQITNKGDYFFIMDLGSKNGVMVDSRRIPPHQHFPLYRGMKIVLANHFEFSVFDDIEEVTGKKDETGELKLSVKGQS